MKKRYIRIAGLILMLAVLLCACSSPEKEADAPEKSETGELSPIVQAADELYQEGKYTESLEQYLIAMEQDIKDVNARLGAANCLIDLGNYELAAMNLSMAQQIAPDSEEICQLYLRLSDVTGSSSYARTAVSLAKQFEHTSILEKVPEAPAFQMEEGSYSERLYLDITCNDPEAQVYVTVSNDSNSDLNLYDFHCVTPIDLLRGKNTVTAYSIKNGIPSDSVTATYTIDYAATEVTFQEPLIEQIVRQTLGKNSGSITNYDCEQVSDLIWSELQDLYTNYSEYNSLRITSLEDLKYFPALTNIYLPNQTEIADFSPLRYCSRLRMIQLPGCGLTDASLVTYTPNATSLYLYSNEITDFSALEAKTNISTLYTYGNGAGSIDGVLKNNPDINSIAIDGAQLSDSHILQEMENLYYVSIYGFQNIDTSVFTSMKQLEQLDLSYNYTYDYYERQQLSLDLSFLQGMDQLTYLYLNGVNDVSQLEYLKGLSNLDTLYLYNCDAALNESAMKSLIQSLPHCSISY